MQWANELNLPISIHSRESTRIIIDILKTQKAKILANPEAYDEDLIKAAGKAVITPALKTDNRLIDLSQGIVEKSILGSGEIIIPKRAAQAVTESALNDFVKPLVNNTDATQTGRLFIDALTDSKELFKAQAKTGYGLLDQEVAKLGNSRVVDITKYNKALQKELNELPKGGVNTPSAKALLEKNIYKDIFLYHHHYLPIDKSFLYLVKEYIFYLVYHNH